MPGIVEGAEKVYPITIGAVEASQVFKLEHCYYSSDLYSPSENPLGEPLTTEEMKGEPLLKGLNLGRDFYPWQIFEGKNDGFPLPFGDGSWKPSSIGSVEVTDTFFTVEKGKLISPDGVRIVAVYALDGSVCNPDTLTEGACYVVRAISSRGECIAQKIIVPQL